MTTATKPQQPRPTPAESKPAPTAPSQEASLLDQVLEQTVIRIDRTAQRFEQELANPMVGRLQRAVMTASAIQRLREMITPPIMDTLRALMNSPLGFMTDRGPQARDEKNRTPYPDNVIRDCAIEALLKGVLWTENQFNIIAGRCYLTQEGYRYKLRNLPELTDLKPAPGVPAVHNGRTVVRFGASWRYKGKADRLMDGDGRPGLVFAIIQNQYSSADQLVGKALRKGLKAIWEQIHGSDHSDQEDDEVLQVAATEPAGRAAEVAAKLGAGNGSGSRNMMTPIQKQRISELSGDLELTQEQTLALCGEPNVKADELTAEQADRILTQLQALVEERG